jgi:hypothetical protein
MGRLCATWQVEGLLGGCEVLGFAGVDYEGPAPPWLILRRCRIRTKNGADFVLAFEAGRIMEAARISSTSAENGAGVCPARAVAPARRPPTVVIVTKDAGLEVVVDELRQCDVPCKLIKNVAELGEMVRAMSILDTPAPGT